MVLDPTLQWTLGVTIILYVIAMFALAWYAQKNVETNEDFVVAGRSLPLSLAWMTLLATWFGAGTLLTATNEVHQNGASSAALDPLGCGLCLLLAGLLIATPLWRMGLLTLPDFFRRKFGPAAEWGASFIMVPSYFGWIAAQYLALAAMLELFFQIPIEYGVVIVAVIGTGYTLLGGMWSVTLTDAVQITLVLIGLVVMGYVMLEQLGTGDLADGWTRLMTETPADRLALIPQDSLREFWTWTGVLAVGALGNIPGQDLVQRIFSSKSERVARQACYVAGGVYLGFGMIPIGIGLIAAILVPEHQESIMPVLLTNFLHPAIAVIFTLVLMSAVLSTIDSAIMAPSSVLAQNVFAKITKFDMLALNRWSVVLVGAVSLGLAYLDDARSLLENAYLITMVGLFVPLILGIYTTPRSVWPAVASMLVGCGLWLTHFVLTLDMDEEPPFLFFVPGLQDNLVPISIGCTLAALLAYLIVEPPWTMRRAVHDTPSPPAPQAT